MSDQPLSDSPITAQVFKQWTIKAAEIGKAGIIAGICAGLQVLYIVISQQKLPSKQELIAAGLVALTTAMSVVIRDITKPTITVIKGQEQPSVKIKNGTVITTDMAPGA